jgi:hypothetical protein
MNANQLNEIAAANLSEWKRTVEENQGLQQELRVLRAKYGLPISRSEFHKWYSSIEGSDENQRQHKEQFYEDVVKLAKKYELNMQKWGNPFIYLVVLGEVGPIFLESGYPSVAVSIDEEGRIFQRIEPTLDTAISNPIIQQFMASIHKSNVLTLDPPPQPQKEPRGRGIDWRPILEWSKRHPDFSLKEIAQILGFSYGTVRNRLSSLDSLDHLLTNDS